MVPAEKPRVALEIVRNFIQKYNYSKCSISRDVHSSATNIKSRPMFLVIFLSRLIVSFLITTMVLSSRL